MKQLDNTPIAHSILNIMAKQPIWLTYSLWLTLLMGQGCVPHSDFPAISSKNFNLSSVNISPDLSKGKTQARHCQYSFLFFTFGEATNLENALDAALQAKRAEILLEAEVSWQFVWIPILYTQECWKVEGIAYDVYY